MEMSLFAKIFFLGLSALFIQNFVVSRFLGLCAYLGVSKKLDAAFGMGLAVIFVMTLSGAICYVIDAYLLVPYGLQYLRTIAFILTIAALVQFVEMVILKNSPALYKALGIYLPLITTNCAVLGVVLLNTSLIWPDGKPYNFLDATLNGCFSGIGFTFVLLLMAGIRERLEYAEIPKTMQGFAIGMILAGSMALAFWGFMGYKM